MPAPAVTVAESCPKAPKGNPVTLAFVHGGLRYLAHGEIGLARESARERAVLMGTTAPHLVRPLPFLVPDVAGRDVTALAAAGGRLGDLVRRSVPGGRGSLPGPDDEPGCRNAGGGRGRLGGSGLHGSTTRAGTLINT